MWEIVERSMNSGGVSMYYSGYETEEDAEEEAKELADMPENTDYWYEVRRQRG